jgi:hypothetical protein
MDKENMTATEAKILVAENDTQRALHQRVEWFTEKWAPVDRRNNAEFAADFMMVVQAIHTDANRHTHALLTKSLAAMPASIFKVEK